MRPDSRHRRTLTSLFGWLLAISMAAGLLVDRVATSHHLASTVHAVCDVHGVIEDVGPHPSEAPGRRAPGMAPGTDRGDEHRPCDATAHAKGGVAVLDRPVLTGLLPALDRVLLLGEGRAGDQPAVAILRLAPKTSPPSAWV